MEFVLIALIKIILVLLVIFTTVANLVYAERKISAAIQNRIGPNRVGPWGVLQPLADGVKFIFKEELVPAGANKLLFRLAPMMAAAPAMMSLAVIPFAGDLSFFGFPTKLAIADFPISAMYIPAVAGMGVYGIILGGWSSNSKYSLLGGLRASAQMISYELALILAILAVVVMTGSLSLDDIVAGQRGGIEDWNLWRQPLAFVLFVIATFAETNRHPFDFAECEPELVGGFHTEYSSMKFALFFLGEYVAMIVMASLTTTLFLGGYEVPWFPEAPWFLQLGAFLVKTSFFLFLFLWVRWTLPRFRFDQLMKLGWKTMLPLSLANTFVTGLVISLG